MHTVRIRHWRDLADVIRYIRKDHGTQAEIAEELGMTRFYLADLEDRRSSPLVIRRLFRLLRRLGITIYVTYEAPRRSD